MTVTIKKIEYIPLDQLKLSNDNPRKITKDKFKQLCDDIKADVDFLECRPILVYIDDGEHIVYAGNQRVRACRELGYFQAPCIVDHKSNLDDDIIRRRIIIDNRHSGQWDFDELADKWDVNMLVGCGFDTKEFDIGLDLDSDKPKKGKKDKKCPHCGEDI